MVRKTYLGTPLTAFCCAFTSLANSAEPEHWTGVYVGLNAGYYWSDSSTVVTTSQALPGGFMGTLAAAASGTFDTGTDGFIGGVQGGASWMLGPALLVGIEGDIQGLSGNTIAPRVQGAGPARTELTIRNELEFLSTLRGRVGVFVLPTLLLYGTGGLAVGFTEQLTEISQDSGFGSSTDNETLVGWVVGAGFERFLGERTSLKAEYLYYDLGRVSAVTNSTSQEFSLAVPPVDEVYLRSRSSTDFNGHILRIGFNVRLD